MGLAQYLIITTLQLVTHQNTAVSTVTGMQTSPCAVAQLVEAL